MYPCMEFQSIWKTSNFGTKLFQENTTDKNFEKNTHQNDTKFTEMYPCMKFQSFCRISNYGIKFAQKK